MELKWKCKDSSEIGDQPRLLFPELWLDELTEVGTGLEPILENYHYVTREAASQQGQMEEGGGEEEGSQIQKLEIANSRVECWQAARRLGRWADGQRWREPRAPMKDLVVVLRPNQGC